VSVCLVWPLIALSIGEETFLDLVIFELSNECGAILVGERTLSMLVSIFPHAKIPTVVIVVHGTISILLIIGPHTVVEACL